MSLNIDCPSSDSLHYLERELNERLAVDRTIYDFLRAGSLDGVWYWDLQNKEAEWMSPRFWTTLGFDPATKSHSPSAWMDLMHPDDLVEAQKRIGEHLENPSVPYDQVTRYRHADGSTVWIRCRGIAICDDQGVPTRMLGAHNDVTDLMRARDELSSKVKELERSNEALTTFAHATSHDLREPLRAVRGFVGLLDEELRPTLTEDQRQYIDFALSGTARMSALIDDLLTLSSVNARPIRREPVDLRATLEAVRSDLASVIATSGGTVEVEDLPWVSGEAGQIRQLLQNLVANAVKFRRDVPVKVRVSATTQGEFVRVEVADNGIGIADKFRERVFKIFQRLHSRETYEGTGIGLAICKGIVERHGGEIGVDSIEGEGATFWVTLPRSV